MKKLILLLVIAVYCTPTQAQKLKEKNVPEVVISAFKKAHPEVNNTEWCKEGNNYEASYCINKTDKFSVYDYMGTKIEIEVEVADFVLPAPTVEYMKKNYNKNKVKDTTRVTYANGSIIYGVELKNIELIFDSNGGFIKSTKNVACVFIAKPIALF